jgi:Asp/Glu/hydantoin racemase
MDDTTRLVRANDLAVLTAGQLTSNRERVRDAVRSRIQILAAAAVGAGCASILFVVPIRPIGDDTLVPAGVVAKEVTH